MVSFSACRQPTSILQFLYVFMLFVFVTVFHSNFCLLYASTIALISCAHECNVIDCEYPHFWFFFSLTEYSHLNAELKVNSRKRIEWLQQNFLKCLSSFSWAKSLDICSALLIRACIDCLTVKHLTVQISLEKHLKVWITPL